MFTTCMMYAETKILSEAKSLEQINELSQKITQVSPKTHLSIIDEPDLIV